MNDGWLESWDIHSRIIAYLLDALEPEGLQGLPQGMSGRSVGAIFAHIHNVRLMWLDVASPDLMTGVEKIPMRKKADRAALTVGGLRQSLQASAAALRLLLERGFESGKVKNFKPHPAAFYSYVLGHEWYHVGEICMTLTQAGHRLPDDVLYGIWEWRKFVSV